MRSTRVPGAVIELTTVADDEVVLHLPASDDRPAEVHRYPGLQAGSEYRFEGVDVRTLERPGGQLLARVATVNDLHFGETVCGFMEGMELESGMVLRSGPGEDPYPEVMNRAAVDEMVAARPDLVVAKGDLTDAGDPADLAAFRACYAPLADRLEALPGNHDVVHGPVQVGGTLPRSVTLPGVVVALVDTALPGHPGGAIPAGQLEWLDELGSRADRPVLVMGHHHPWAPGSANRPPGYFGVEPDSSEALVGVFARRPRLAAFLAGHTHRNRVRRFGPTGPVPWVEVASVKEFPGCWAEYRVFEGGILQVLHRISTPAALAWSERTRALFGGMYPAYAFGRLEDRCFPVTTG